MKVLIVDDSAELRAIMVEVLQDRGLEILEARNGLECLEQFKSKQPEVIVLDLIMPFLNGIETLKQIRALDSRVRVVVVTGSMYSLLYRMAYAHGANAIYTKPFDLQQFGRHIASLAALA